GGDRVVFAVAMHGYQDFGLVVALRPGPDEGSEEMLAVPEREDARQLRLDPLIDVGWVDDEMIGVPDQPQIFGREETHSTLKPAAAQRIAKQLLQRPGFVACLASVLGSSRRCRCTMK